MQSKPEERNPMMLMSRSRLVKLLLLICVSFQAIAQDTAVHRLRKAIDIPLTAAGVAGTLFGVYLRQNKEPSDSVTIVNLDPGKLPPIDRRVIYEDDYLAGKVSDYFLGAGFVIPWFLAFDDKVNDHLGTYSMLYLQTMALAGTEYWGTAGMIDKYRPYVYNPDVPLGKRISKHSKNSFFAGHVTITAAGSFFTAQVLNDLHPDSKYRAWGYVLASLVTATNGYLRYKGGFHFFSDIAVGTAAGAATGILVPVLHRRKSKDNRLGIIPFAGEVNGVCLTLKIP